MLKVWTYFQLHLPTGLVHDGKTFRAMPKSAFLSHMADWNRSPDWKYWSDDPALLTDSHNWPNIPED